MGKTRIEFYQEEKGVSLTEEQKYLMEDYVSFHYTHKDKYCQICGCELADADKMSKQEWMQSFNITCKKHRHLSQVFNVGYYFKQYDTLDLVPDFENQEEKHRLRRFIYEKITFDEEQEKAKAHAEAMFGMPWDKIIEKAKSKKLEDQL